MSGNGGQYVVAGRALPASMRRSSAAANLAVVLVLLACLLALTSSVYPGVLNDLVFLAILLSFIVAPVVGIIGSITLFVLVWRGRLKGAAIRWGHVAAVIAILFGTYILLKKYVPRRIAFATSRSAFEQLVAQAPASDCQGSTLDKRLGVYRVDEYAADPRGGVYFRVYSGSDGIGPDVMSYGFCYNPNPEGTPFGAAHYRRFRMGNGWCWFRASDDWH